MADDAGAVILAELRAEMARQRRKNSELAVVLGKSRQAAWAKLTGLSRFTPDELVKAADWLGVSLDKLAGRAA